MNSIKIEKENGMTVISLDLPGRSMNILTPGVLGEIDDAFTSIREDESVRGIVFISGKSGSFIAGMDVGEIESITDAGEGARGAAVGQAVFDRIDRMQVPVVCAIDGVCLGGGMELALACDFRIASDNPKTVMGQPEVLIGIFPGFGGSQRLPRLVGIQTALGMILTGRNFPAKKAFRVGLVDSVVPVEYLKKAAFKLAHDAAEGKAGNVLRQRKKKNGGVLRWLLERNALGRSIVFRQARKSVLKQTRGNYPAPLKAIEAVRKGTRTSMEKGLRLEARLVGELIASRESKNLIGVYYLRERGKKLSVMDDVEIPGVERAAVLGAGVMGGGIAQLLASNGIEVRLRDIDAGALGLGLRQARRIFEKAKRSRRITHREMERGMALISGTLDHTGFSRSDFVFEAIVEKMTVKKAVIGEVEGYLQENAVIASNTSSLSITEMAMAAKIPERIVGMHFFNPVYKMPLVEVIRGERSGDEAIEKTIRLAKELGKTPILVKDSAGFLVNRLLGVYLNEACHMFKEGADVEWVDGVMLDFGMPMGPYRLLDEVGLDIALHAGMSMEAAFGERMKASPLLSELSAEGLTGKKGGKGFFLYGGKKGYNSALDKMKEGNIGKPDREEVVDRLVLPMVSEAALSLDEGIVSSPEDVDTGMVFGTGFAPFRGGLLRYADTEGAGNVAGRLERLAEKYGERLAPSDALRGIADSGGGFY